MAWEVHHNNTNWSATTGMWSAGTWESLDGYLELIELGTWVEGYRPTKIRITYTGDPNTALYLRDSNNAIIAQEGNTFTFTYQSLEEENITFGNYDIRKIEMYNDWGDDPDVYINVTNIEFYGPDGWTGIINGVTNPAKINEIAVANIKSVS